MPPALCNLTRAYCASSSANAVGSRERIALAVCCVVPFSAALGYAEESGIPYEQALIRNHYVRRTFIEPAQAVLETQLGPSPTPYMP